MIYGISICSGVHGATPAPYLVMLTQNKSPTRCLAAGDLKWHQNARHGPTLNNYMHIWVAYIITRLSDVHELWGSLLYEVIFYLYFILDLMKEWSAFNGQGRWSVLTIWQLFEFLLRCNLPGFTVIMKFRKDLLHLSLEFPLLASCWFSIFSPFPL